MAETLAAICSALWLLLGAAFLIMSKRIRKQINNELEELSDSINAEISRWNSTRWISVEDQMPELFPCKAGTAYSEAVVVLTKDRNVVTAVWDGIDWIGDFMYWEAEGEEVTHWMPVCPLPKLPGR